MGNNNSKDEVKEAYEHWQHQRPLYKNMCCTKAHYYMDDTGRCLWRPDSDVCARENAWRNYVRVRDCNPNFPFGDTFYN